MAIQFQSTLLMRGATLVSDCRECFMFYFNPRSSCEERLSGINGVVTAIAFQSTLLMRGATRDELEAMDEITLFQSTLLMRGATLQRQVQALVVRDFNPRSSCEERLEIVKRSLQELHISIHAPHARSDCVTFKH